MGRNYPIKHPHYFAATYKDVANKRVVVSNDHLISIGLDKPVTRWRFDF